MELKNILSIAATIILSLGGSAAIIIAIAKWLGELLSNRIIERYKFRHDKDLEELKSKYSQELERVKSDLDKSKHLFLKYSDKQFELYNNLWKVLWDIKQQADSLWEEATPRKLPKFANSLKNAKNALYLNILLIDENHFTKILSIIEEFEKFEFGKQKLLELREIKKERVSENTDEESGEIRHFSHQASTTTNIGISEQQVRDVIANNGNLKIRFDAEIMELSRAFRSRLKG